MSSTAVAEQTSRQLIPDAWLRPQIASLRARGSYAGVVVWIGPELYQYEPFI